jgi:hypothetical protein
MMKLAMASFDFLLFGCGLERPGGFNVGDQHWHRRLEAVGLKVQWRFLERANGTKKTEE